MTCLEKLREDHPDFPGDAVKRIIEDDCPNSDWGTPIRDPKNCGEGITACEQCWNRELPTEETAPACGIKDSGERREFDTGAVRDIQEGKGRCDLMPLDIIGEITSDPVIIRIADFVATGGRGYLKMALDEFQGNDPFEDVPTMLLEVAKHFENGAKKYGEHNWQKGVPVRCYIDSAVRHYLKYLRDDQDEPHDRAFCWNIICAIWTCKHKPELNEYKEN